jgi:hypothetical protein
MNKLIKPVLCILFLLAPCYKSFGQVRVGMPVRRYMPAQRYPRQNKPNPGKRIELVKEGFISRQLKLNPDESRAFWPLYRQYVQDQTAIRILKRQNMSNSSADGTKQIDLELQYETELVNIRKHYRDEFLKILPPEKVSELYKSERQFNDEVLKQLSERSVRAGD